MESIITKEIDVQEFGSQFDKATDGYFAIKSRDLFVGTVLPFDALFPALNEVRRDVFMRVMLPEGRAYDQPIHDWLLREGIEDIYLKKDKENIYLEYLSENVKKLIQANDIPSEKKTMLLYDSAESIVSKVFRERPSRENIALGHDLIENLAVHLTLDAVTSTALLGIFSKDYDTFTHSVQVAVLGMAFCNYLGWSKQEVTDFGIGALFHDVGKSRVEDEILNKPGRLTEDEFEIIKKHTLIGYQQLKNTQTLSKNQLSVPLSHHESMDGTGYPQGLKGDEIHKFARVARIVDCYDALTTKRAYKDAMPSSKALALMGSEMGPSFDMRLLDAFKSFLMSTEEKMQENHQGKRLNLELGNEVYVKLDDIDYELKMSVMGMQVDELLILRIPKGVDLQEHLSEGKVMTARYTQTGTAYKFTSAVLGYVSHPVPFVMLSYPKRLETPNMRKDTRNECLFRAQVRIRDGNYMGVILNMSEGGCKMVLKLSEDDKLPAIGVGDSLDIQVQSEDKQKTGSMKGVVRNLSMAKGKALLGVQFV